MSPRDPSQQQPRDARPERTQGGEKPLLQGHLKKKRVVGGSAAEPSSAAPTPAAAPIDAVAPEAKRKRTRGKAVNATLPNLEGSEQGPA